MIKYKASAWWPRIEKVEIVSETEKFVTIQYGNRTRREAKLSNDSGFFDTFEEAKQFIVDYRLKRVESAQEILSREIEKLAEAQELKE